MQAAQLRQQQSIGWKGRWGGPRLFLKECQRNKQIWHHWKNHSTSWSSVYWLSRPSTVSLDKKYSYINNYCTFFLITIFPLSDPVSLNNLICIIIAGVCHCDITWINILSAISLKYARIWKGQKLYNEPYPLIITNQRFVQDLKVCFTNPQPGRAMTSRSHLPSLSGNKLDYHPLPAGSPLLSLYDKCFPFFMTRRTESGSDMTGPRSGTRPPGGSWSTTTCKSWRKARLMEIQRDATIPQSYPTLAERKIVTSTLDSSTPLLALNMRPVVSMLIISFNKSTTPLFQKKKKKSWWIHFAQCSKFKLYHNMLKFMRYQEHRK